MENAEFEQLVNLHYEALYRFALSLTRSEAASCDLTQQTFYLWATKGHQLRDRTKAKSWLFTTLHREFLGSRRRETRFPHHEMAEVDHELPSISPTVINDLDGNTVIDSLLQVDEVYRAPLMLFYLEDFSYQEIAEQLDIPIGTVMSRLSRGKTQLRQSLCEGNQRQSHKIIPLSEARKEAKSRG
ncbi:MAG TPA: RNA polymerase sigma factor [Verrucomicrobiae bacterium]